MILCLVENQKLTEAEKVGDETENRGMKRTRREDEGERRAMKRLNRDFFQFSDYQG